jgi:hypothetical protein
VSVQLRRLRHLDNEPGRALARFAKAMAPSGVRFEYAVIRHLDDQPGECLARVGNAMVPSLGIAGSTLVIRHLDTEVTKLWPLLRIQLVPYGA